MAGSPLPHRRRLSFGRWSREFAWRHVVGVAALLFALFPVWFVVIAAFSDSASLSNQKLWPEVFTLRQLRALLDGYPFWNWFVNSLLISFATTPSANARTIGESRFARIRSAIRPRAAPGSL